MIMKLYNLVDEKKRAKLRAAMKRGDFGALTRKEGETAKPEPIEPIKEPENSPSSRRIVPHGRHFVELALENELLKAVEKNDPQAVEDAIRKGANPIEATVFEDLSNHAVEKDDENEERTFYGRMVPVLAWAVEKGYDRVAEVLRKHGAKE